MAQSLEKQFIASAMKASGFHIAASALENNDLFIHDLRQTTEQWKRHQNDADTFFDPWTNSWYKAATNLSPRIYKG